MLMEETIDKPGKYLKCRIKLVVVKGGKKGGKKIKGSKI